MYCPGATNKSFNKRVPAQVSSASREKKFVARKCFSDSTEHRHNEIAIHWRPLELRNFNNSIRNGSSKLLLSVNGQRTVRYGRRQNMIMMRCNLVVGKLSIQGHTQFCCPNAVFDTVLLGIFTLLEHAVVNHAACTITMLSAIVLEAQISAIASACLT